MNEIDLSDKTIAMLLAKHGDGFVCCKKRSGSTYINNTPEVRIASSGASMRRQIDSGDFTLQVSTMGSTNAGVGNVNWVVFLKAKFRARSPYGTLRADLTYEAVGPTPSRLLALHEAAQVESQSKVKDLPPKRSLAERKDMM